MKQLTLNGKTYQRDFEKIAEEVQSVHWFEVTEDSLKEVYDIETLNELEVRFETITTESFTPQPFII